MKIKDIKKYGYYVDTNDSNIIVEAFRDNDNGKEILSVMIWEWFETKDGVRFFATDMFALNPENEDICNAEVVPTKTKFKIVDDNDKYYIQYGASSVMYEDKLSNTEKLTKIKNMCIKESKSMTFRKTQLGDSVLDQTDRAKLAEKVLKVLYD